MSSDYTSDFKVEAPRMWYFSLCWGKQDTQGKHLHLEAYKIQCLG